VGSNDACKQGAKRKRDSKRYAIVKKRLLNAHKKEIMPRVICPACGKGISINSDEVNFYNQLVRPRCGALLAIVEEDPLTVEEVPIES